MHSYSNAYINRAGLARLLMWLIVWSGGVDRKFLNTRPSTHVNVNEHPGAHAPVRVPIHWPVVHLARRLLVGARALDLLEPHQDILFGVAVPQRVRHRHLGRALQLSTWSHRKAGISTLYGTRLSTVRIKLRIYTRKHQITFDPR